MNLATHVVVGAAAAAGITANPVAAFFVGLASHYLIDIIPHKGRKVYSLEEGSEGLVDGTLVQNVRLIATDFALAFLDIAIGVALITAIFFPYVNMTLLLVLVSAAIGSVLPDALHFVYVASGRMRVLRPHQRFHAWIQTWSKEPVQYIPLRAAGELLIVFVALAGFAIVLG